MKKNHTILWVLLVLVVPGAILCATILLAWDEAHCVHTDIDVHSGDIRVQKYTCFVKVGEDISQTPFSKLVRKLLGERPDAEWRRVTTTGTLLRDVHIAGPWHDAIFMCDFFMRTVDTGDLSEARQRILLEECLHHLGTGNMTGFESVIEEELHQSETSEVSEAKSSHQD